MFEALSLDIAILYTSIGAGLIGIGGGAYMLFRAQAPKQADVSDIVANAPYHRLHNTLKVKASS